MKRNKFKALFYLQKSIAPDDRVLLAVTVMVSVLSANGLVSLFDYPYGSGVSVFVWLVMVVIGCLLFMPVVGCSLGFYQMKKIQKEYGEAVAKKAMSLVSGSKYSGCLNLDDLKQQ